MIEYRETHDVDIFQLARLLGSVGMHRELTDLGKLAELVRNTMYVVSAWHGERLVGFARAVSDGVRNAYISTVAVLPPYQRRGIGREMIGRLLAGRDHLTFVLHARHEVHSFYAHHGFTACTEMLRRERRTPTPASSS